MYILKTLFENLYYICKFDGIFIHIDEYYANLLLNNMFLMFGNLYYMLCKFRRYISAKMTLHNVIDWKTLVFLYTKINAVICGWAQWIRK